MKTNRPKLVCDMMIWYGLGNGSIDPSQLRDFLIESNYINHLEVITTYKLQKDKKFVVNGINAMVKFSELTNFRIPMLHINNLATNNSDEGKALYATDNVYRAMRAFGEGQMVSNYNKTLDKFCELEKDAVRQQLVRIENEKSRNRKVFDNNLKKFVENVNLIERIKELTISDVTAITQKLENFSEFDWSNLELFINASAQFYKNIFVSQDIFEPNDIYDMYNLVYIQPGDLYFTKEKKWKRIITQAGFEHYLYEKL